MTTKTYNIYCDESTHLPRDKRPYMLMGFVGVPYPFTNDAKNAINDIKRKYGFKGELKWTNICKKTEPMYAELIEYFFRSNLKFRAVVIKKSEIDENRPEYTFNDFYFRMYYQLLHIPLMGKDNAYNVYFDIKDTCSHLKLKKLKECLQCNSSIRHFQFIRSHESQLMQLADVLMGAINYNLRVSENDIPGCSDSKNSIVRAVKQYSNISLEKSTYPSEEKFNLFFIKLR